MFLERSESSTVSVESAVGLIDRQRRDRRKERQNTEVLNAAAANDAEAVLRVLENGGSPEARCREGFLTACHVTVLFGNCSALRVLLEAGASPALRDRMGRQPHHLAAALGHALCLEMLLEKEPSLVNSPVQPQTQTSLFRDTIDSWNHNHEDLNKQVPQNITIGSTALHLASKRGDWNSVDFLLLKGANVEGRDIEGLSPLDVVGVDVSPKNEDTVDSQRSQEPSSVESQVCKTVTLLLSKGAKIPKTNIILKENCVMNQCKLCITALHTAVRLQDLEMTEYLINAGASLKTWDKAGLTPVHIAVLQESEIFLKSLLSLSNPNEIIDLRDIQGRTPLHFAVKQGWSDGIELLLLIGCKITSTSNDNQTVLHIAAENGYSTILKELLSSSESQLILEYRNSMYETAVWRAVACKHYECVKILWENKVDMTVTLPGDYTLLHLATKNNTPDILQFLLQRIPREQINTICKAEKGGLAPLHLAAKEGHTECLLELLSAGADQYIKASGETPLHIAARTGHFDVVKVLCNQDSALLKVRNEEGFTPLHVAAGEGFAEITKEMILYGGDISVSINRKSGEKTAIDIILRSIPNSVNFLKNLFDEFIETNGYPTSDPKCNIKIRYDVLIPQGRAEKQLTVIDALLNCGKKTVQEKLFLHPLIETFLYHKWKKLKNFYFFIMFLYGTLTVSLTTTAHMLLIDKRVALEHGVLIDIFRILLFSSLLPIVILEMLNACQMKRYYCVDYESWIKWGVILSATTVAVVVDFKVTWLRYLASISVLLCWIELLFLLSRSPAFGYYVHMFSSVALNVFKVLTTFAFLVIGFSFAFLILFEAKEPFGNLLEAIVKVIVMTFEYDYEDMFENARELTPFSIIGRLLFAFFVILIGMVMMNLITSLSVSDITVLKAHGECQRLAKQAAFLSLLEHCFFPGPGTKAVPPAWAQAIVEIISVPESMSFHPSRIRHELPRAIAFSVIENVNARRRNFENKLNCVQLEEKLIHILKILNASTPHTNLRSLVFKIEEILSEISNFKKTVTSKK